MFDFRKRARRESRSLFSPIYFVLFSNLRTCPCKRPTSNNSLIKDATSSSKVATLDEKVASLESKDTKAIVFCRKDDFPSLFRGELANFVCVLYLIIRYNSSE